MEAMQKLGRRCDEEKATALRNVAYVPSDDGSPFPGGLRSEE